MPRRLIRSVSLALAAITLGGCPSYDAYGPLASQGGLMEADQFAAYGREQAQAVAIGREFAMALDDRTPSGRAAAAATAAAFARRLPDVMGVQVDSLGYRLTVTFRSGWVRPVLPIGDGRNGAETPGLPALRATPPAR